MPEVNEEDYFPMELIIDGIRPNKYAVAKLEFYSNHFKDDQHEKTPELIAKTLEVTLILIIESKKIHYSIFEPINSYFKFVSNPMMRSRFSRSGLNCFIPFFTIIHSHFWVHIRTRPAIDPWGTAFIGPHLSKLRWPRSRTHRSGGWDRPERSGIVSSNIWTTSKLEWIVPKYFRTVAGSRLCA